MLGWIIDFLLSGLAIMVIAWILPGVEIKSYKTALWVAFLIGLLDATIGFVMRILAFPFNWLTFGLLNFIIYVIVIIIVDKLVTNFNIRGFLWAFVFAVLMTFASGLIDRIVY